MPAGASPKRERQYQRIKQSAKKSGRYGGRAEEVAARTVNKIRREKGETKSQGGKKSSGSSGSRKSSSTRAKSGRSSASRSKSSSSSRSSRGRSSARKSASTRSASRGRSTSSSRRSSSRSSTRRSSTARRTSGKSRRGFAGMSDERQRQIASQGGRAAHRQGTAHEFSTSEARQAGQKGGEAVSRDRRHMAEIGRRGGER